MSGLAYADTKMGRMEILPEDGPETESSSLSSSHTDAIPSEENVGSDNTEADAELPESGSTTMETETSTETSTESSSNSSTGSSWVLSEEEQTEAYNYGTTQRFKTQLKLDPLQVCLFPTYLTLPQDVLQADLQDSLQDLVSATLTQEYGPDFVYFAMTDASTLDWYSGDEGTVCAQYQTDALTTEQRTSHLFHPGPHPCTCALYPGATVMLRAGAATAKEDEDAAPGAATPEVLEATIAQAVETDLVQTLRDYGTANRNRNANSNSQGAFYTELKGAGVSWTAAQRLQGGKLVYLDTVQENLNNNNLNNNIDQQLVVPESLAPQDVVEEDTIPVLDEVVEDSTVIDVVQINALEGSDLQEDTKANAFSSQRGKILAACVGAVLLVVLVVLGCVLRLKKRLRQKQQGDEPGKLETSTVISHDEVDEEIARGGRRIRKKFHTKKKKTAAVDEDGGMDDESEAAQYQRGHTSSNNNNNLLDCISVGSEWTLTTGVTDGVSSALGLSTSGNNKTRAELLAAKETFDRDRQITLQKDMLQSDWNAPPPSGLPLSRADSLALKGTSGSLYSINRRNSKQQQPPNALQFEEAGGEGEEIFLMEPATR